MVSHLKEFKVFSVFLHNIQVVVLEVKLLQINEYYSFFYNADDNNNDECYCVPSNVFK